MDQYKTFPDYVYSPNSKKLYVAKTGHAFMDHSEYGDGGPIQFTDANQAKQFLNENEYKGVMGIRFIN